MKSTPFETILIFSLRALATLTLNVHTSPSTIASGDPAVNTPTPATVAYAPATVLLSSFSIDDISFVTALPSVVSPTFVIFTSSELSTLLPVLIVNVSFASGSTFPKV